MAKPVGPYTPIVRAGEWLVVSGQVGIVDGKLVPAASRRSCARPSPTWPACWSQRERRSHDVTKTTVFLRHLGSDYLKMNDVYVELFGDHRPARSAVGVADLPIGALVEVEAWAHVGAG